MTEGQRTDVGGCPPSLIVPRTGERITVVCVWGISPYQPGLLQFHPVLTLSS